MATESTNGNAGSSDDRNRSLDATERALEEFQKRLAAGEDVDEKEFLREHPELTDEFAMIFEWLGALKRQQGPPGGEGTGDSTLFGCPRVLGDFRIVRHIGSGGMANVFEAEQIRLKRRVALKVLAPQLALSEKSILKFKREAEAAGRQNHPGIIAIHDVGEQDGFYYIATEYVPGEMSLADRLEELRSEGDLPRGYFRETAALIADTALALQHAHDSSVIHRDVKPSNILIGTDGRPKVSDFGLAKVGDALSLSRSGDFSGTPYYMSPEQVIPGRKGIDHRTDVFSLGVTLYEALTLERPFEAETSHQILRKIQLHEARDPQKIDPRLPRDLALICRKAMEKDPGHRYQSMAEFASELRRFLAGESILTRPAGFWRRSLALVRRHKLASTALGAVLVATLSLAILAFVVSSQTEREFEYTRSRYKLAGEVMELGRKFEETCRWCLDADTRDPSGAMALAICYIQALQYDDAIASLDECVDKSRTNEMPEMEREARYLLAVIRMRQSDSLDRSSDEWRALTARAEEDLDSAGDFAPSSPDSLIWRHRRDRSSNESSEPWYRQPLRVNQEHYLADLCDGLKIFRILHLGGARASFDRAIRHFENVLEVRSENVVALTFLARVKFFYARHYGDFHLLSESRDLLEKAMNLAGHRPYPMLFTTRGQVALLAGDDQKAMECFENAQRAATMRGESDPNVHNIHKGIGMVYARRGDLDKALESVDQGLGVMVSDSPLHVAKALLHIENRDLDEAVRSCEAAKEIRLRRMIIVSNPTHYAPAHLVCALAHAARNDYEEVVDNAWELLSMSIHSPRYQSLGCLLIATLPAEVIEEPEFRGGVSEIAARLAVLASFADHDERSPIILSALGAAALLRNDNPRAMENLNRAMAVREKLWSAELLEFHWPETARDLYLLAMVHHRSAGGDESKLNEARSCFDKAEEIHSRSDRLVDEGGLVDMMRHKARVILGLEE